MGAMGAALVSAGASIAGDVYASQGAQATNAKDMQMMYAQDSFNARQSLANKRFQHNEAQLQRSWSAKEVASQDAFQQRMADTMMQRRVADLRRARLNPALAYELGGAAAPSGATPTSGTPQGSQASSSGIPTLQNPNIGFGQLGAQVASAAQLKSTINLQDAQANKLNVEAGTEIPAQVQALQSQTGLNDMKAQESYKNVQVIEKLLEPADANDASMAFALNKIKVMIGNMTAEEQAATLQGVIAVRNSQNLADKVHADNIRKASDGVFGRVMGFFQTGEPAIHSARAIGSTAADVAGVL